MLGDRITRVVIIEDESHNSTMLKGLVNELRPDWKIVAILESVKDSIEWLRDNKAPDLMLVDIQLSDGLSFSIFREIDPGISSRIIFTTAYDEYAIRAFQVNSIDYLLKPIKKEDLESSFRKYEEILAAYPLWRQFSEDDRDYFSRVVDSIIDGRKEYRTRLLIQGFKSYTKLETKDIAFIYSDNKITFAVDFSGKEYMLNYNLEQLESELNPELFFRANRKIIVSLKAVKSVYKDRDGKLILNTEPPAKFTPGISRIKAADFKNWLGA